jgi:hypothetical protein
MIAFAVALLGLAGCGVSVNTGNGGGSNDATGSSESQIQTTSAAEAQELSQALRDANNRSVENRALSDECGEEPEPEKEKCFKEWAELVSVGLSETEAVVNALKAKVGTGCRKALNKGNRYQPLSSLTVGACSEDVGR